MTISCQLPALSTGGVMIAVLRFLTRPPQKFVVGVGVGATSHGKRRGGNWELTTPAKSGARLPINNTYLPSS